MPRYSFPKVGRWNYFTDEETAGLDAELVAMADRARHRAGIPFVLTCGVRSPDANAAVGGVADSAHLNGHAMDFRCDSSVECFKIVATFLAEGAQRIVIGITPSADTAAAFYHNVHVDNDPTKVAPVLVVKLYP